MNKPKNKDFTQNGGETVDFDNTHCKEGGIIGKSCNALHAPSSYNALITLNIPID